MQSEIPPLEQPYAAIASRLAIEGVPIRAIARALARSSEDVRDTLRYHLDIGIITEMTKEDWAPAGRRADRLPSFLKHEAEPSLVLGLQHLFKLTPLEASFMLVFLKRDEVDKGTLHYVIETQRALRKSRPDATETTDPKMVDVIICKLRGKFKPHKIIIHTLWGAGYYLDDTSRSIIEELLGQRSATGDAAAATGLSYSG